MKQDRFLLAILLTIVLLVVLAVALFFVRQERQNYSSDNTPKAVIRNYVIALTKNDYPKAYSYLKEGENKPNFDIFQKAFMSRLIDPSNSAIQIGKTRQTGSEAWVELFVMHGSSGPFGDVYRETTNAQLIRNQAGEWKLANMPSPYWSWDWYNPKPAEKIPQPLSQP